MTHHHSSQHASQAADLHPEQPAPEEQPAPIDPAAIVSAVEAFARENPHAALAGAAAIGFMVGGGLTPRLLGGLAMFVGRKYLSQTLRETLQGAFQEQLGEAPGL